MGSNYSSDKRFAILIDADNVSEKYISIILEEVSTFGIATYKRIYGDWTHPRMTRWKSCLLDNSIVPIQQYSYTMGKNATDAAMIIDAMDILYSNTVDGFALVSSDSDFTRLAARLRESGMQVVGMGEQKTPQPFIAACNQFKYLDLLFAARSAEEAELEEVETQEYSAEVLHAEDRCARQGACDICTEDDELEPSPTRRRRKMRRSKEAESVQMHSHEDEAKPAMEPEAVSFGKMSKADRRRHMQKIRATIETIIDSFSDDDGFVSLGQLGDQLSKRLPDFDVRNYGFKKLRPFIKSLGVYEFIEPETQSGQRQIFLRIKE